MKESKNMSGVLFFFIHFIIEITSFYTVSFYTNSALAWFLAFLYDYLAFVPQGFFGYLKDKGIRLNFAVIGIILSTLALALLALEFNAVIVILILSIGNGMIHIQGAETTLRTAQGKMTPCAVFVSGGAFGVITGKILAMYKVPVILIAAVNLLMTVPVFLCRRYSFSTDDQALENYNFSNKKRGTKTIVGLAVAVVIIRAYMGYGIPTAWNKTTVQTVLLYCFMGLGKALGGILIDRIGIRKTSLLSTVGALPFLLFGDQVMFVSLFGIMLFSMTMAVTLGLIVSELKRYPGVAFGFTTTGLFLGSLPVFFFRIDSLWINGVIVTALTAASALALTIICKKEKA